MGCSKPLWEPCPQSTCTSLCPYWAYPGLSSGGSATSYNSGVAKRITEFTTDELLAEIRRRCGT